MIFLRKPLRDFANALKDLIQDIPENYTIKPLYKSIADEEDIRNGILVFRDFLCQFFDYIITNADLHDLERPHLLSFIGIVINGEGLDF